MFYIIALVVLLIVIIGGIGAAAATRAAGGIVTAAIALVLLIVLTLFTGFTTVDARAVGIQTSFGKYKSTMPNGLHRKAPWSSVEQFSTQVQYLDLDDTDGSKGNDVAITYKGGGGGTVDATVRWRISEVHAKDLWAKYKSFENVRDQLVNSSAKDSFRVVISKYGPNDARDGENLRPIADAVAADLSSTLSDDGVIVDSVSVKRINLDKNSQKALDAVVSANANVDRAKSEQQRAIIDSQTAEIRAKSGSLSGANLQRYCLEVTNAWDVSKNGPLPATWNCLGGSAGTPVIVNSK